jgi:outer membrane protein TolC
MGRHSTDSRSVIAGMRMDCSPRAGRSAKRETRYRARCALVFLLIAHLVGCAPAYRGPRRFDFFRAKPLKYEAFGPLPATQPPGLPLPEEPPAVDSSGPHVAEYDGQEWQLTLNDALCISLSNSGVVRILSGTDVSASSSTRYDPEIADTRLRAALAGFDPYVSSSVYSNWIKQPPDAVFGPGLAEPTQRNEMGYTGFLAKPLTTGGEARIGYNPPLNYLFIPNNGSSTSFNPLYSSNLEFTLRQPLLKGAGFKVNKAPIRIAQFGRDQVGLDTRQAVMASVRSVTEAYWALYSSRAASAVINDVVPLLERVAYIEEERMAVQRSVKADVAKAHAQLRAIRQQAVAAKAAIVQAELRLRNLMGIPPYDGYRIVPVSTPLVAPVTLDPAASIGIAKELRPDLQKQQLQIKTREHQLLIARNQGLPQVDALGTYRWNGVGNNLGDSLAQMYGTYYHDFQAGVTMTMPLGRRVAAANIRAATLALVRERAMMQQALHSTTHQINSLVQEAAYAHQLYTEADARLKANTDWLEGSKIRYENPPPAGETADWLIAATNDYLTALRSQADAVTDTQAFLARYNTALARLSEANGTILNDYDILPVGMETPAVEF